MLLVWKAGVFFRTLPAAPGAAEPPGGAFERECPLPCLPAELAERRGCS